LSKIGIIGWGIVGQAYSKAYGPYATVKVYDPKRPIPQILATTKKGINDCDLVMICVPTTQTQRGTLDHGIVLDVLSWIETPVIVIKSTVIPGFTAHIQGERKEHVVFSPEYIGESTYHTPDAYPSPTDPLQHGWVTLGGNEKATSAALAVLQPIHGPACVFHQTESDVAEMAKLMENSFYATKVSFCHEVAAICEAYDLSYERVRQAFLLDPRVSPMHTAVFDKSRGFGGKCLPKDLKALTYLAESASVPSPVLKASLTHGPSGEEKVKGERARSSR